MGVRVSVWRAALVFRVLAALFSCALIARTHSDYRHPALGWYVAAAILGWTGVTALAVLRRWADTVAFVILDVVVVAGLTLLSIVVETATQRHGGTATLTTVWAAGPALSAGIRLGWRGGLVAALVQSAISIVVRGGWDANTVTNAVLLALAGTTTGYVSELLSRSEIELARVTGIQAAADERERLARSIHDGVLQVLAMVQRRGAELGGDAGVLGRLAGEQEEALRALITSRAHATVDSDQLDIASRLVALRSSAVTVSVPAQTIGLANGRGGELLAAVGAALDNVSRHAGPDAHAWVLLEDLGLDVVVTVRDDGVGVAPGRLQEAAQLGRLGVRASLMGRVEALGGQAVIASTPGQGTEVEIRLPKQVAS
jgi:signal transduction histidine kinase